jgi:hypothetical protein
MDPYCCEVAWDLICEGLAGDVCTCCGLPGVGCDCCDGEPNGQVGCEDETCQALVCSVDEYCCFGWHDGCAVLALEMCEVCSGLPVTGDSGY